MKHTTLLTLLALAALCGANPANASDAEREFSLKVLPLLQEKCFACHGNDPEKIKGDLNLLTREDMLKGGGNSTSVIVPGKAA